MRLPITIFLAGLLLIGASLLSLSCSKKESCKDCIYTQANIDSAKRDYFLLAIQVAENRIDYETGWRPSWDMAELWNDGKPELIPILRLKSMQLIDTSGGGVQISNGTVSMTNDSTGALIIIVGPLPEDTIPIRERLHTWQMEYTGPASYLSYGAWKALNQ